MERIGKSSSVVSYDRLDFINKAHIARRLDDANTRKEFISSIQGDFLDRYHNLMTPHAHELLNDDKYFSQAVSYAQMRVNVMNQFPKYLFPMILQPDLSDPESVKFKESVISEQTRKTLEHIKRYLQGIFQWEENTIKSKLGELAKIEDIRYAEIMKPLRFAATGSKIGIDLPAILYLIGKNETLSRIERAIDTI